MRALASDLIEFGNSLQWPIVGRQGDAMGFRISNTGLRMSNLRGCCQHEIRKHVKCLAHSQPPLLDIYPLFRDSLFNSLPLSHSKNMFGMIFFPNCLLLIHVSNSKIKRILTFICLYVFCREKSFYRNLKLHFVLFA